MLINDKVCTFCLRKIKPFGFAVDFMMCEYCHRNDVDFIETASFQNTNYQKDVVDVVEDENTIQHI